MASDLLLDTLEKEHDSWDEEPYQVRTDFEGDLDTMLYPSMPQLEDEVIMTVSPPMRM